MLLQVVLHMDIRLLVGEEFAFSLHASHKSLITGHPTARAGQDKRKDH